MLVAGVLLLADNITLGYSRATARYHALVIMFFECKMLNSLAFVLCFDLKNIPQEIKHAPLKELQIPHLKSRLSRHLIWMLRCSSLLCVFCCTHDSWAGALLL